MKPRIRPLVICVFKHGLKILAHKGYDSIKRQFFYRPLGGGIHFGETSDVAIRREIFEELGAEIEDLKLLAVKENIFIYNGQPGHEIIFIFDAKFSNPMFYERDVINAHEDDDTPFEAVWIDLSKRDHDSPPIYPEGLLSLLI